MRVCPTHAIRVKNGKAQLIVERCVDCGECIKCCEYDAIVARTDSFSRLKTQEQKYRVAVPSPVIFAQFGMEITPFQILNGLKKIGFDDVHDISPACESTGIAFEEYLKNHTGPRPLISCSCPTVVRLIQVSYPSLTEQIIPIETPREIAAREMKARISKTKKIDTDNIEAVYITPCPAKMVSIKQPAEKERSYFDGAIGICDIYNRLLSVIYQEKKENDQPLPSQNARKYSVGMNWAVVGGESEALKAERCISVSGLSYVIQSLEDLESGKLRNIDLLECYSCVGGCIGGSLTVENLYVARAKMIHLIRQSKQFQKKEEILKKYYRGFYAAEAPVRPRPITPLDLDVLKAVQKKRKKDEIYHSLPQVNCGLCGSPTCLMFAEDVARGDAKISDCVFSADNSLKKLQKIYSKPHHEPPPDSTE